MNPLSLILTAASALPTLIGDVEDTAKKIEADPDLKSKIKDGIEGAAKLLVAAAAVL